MLWIMLTAIITGILTGGIGRYYGYNEATKNIPVFVYYLRDGILICGSMVMGAILKARHSRFYNDKD